MVSSFLPTRPLSLAVRGSLIGEAVRNPNCVDWLNAPRQGDLFEVQHNGFWLEDWGARPDSLAQAALRVNQLISAAPRLIPIPVFFHRMMPDEPCLPGNPVLSVHQTDIIHYGFDLEHYLRREFRLPGLKHWPEQIRAIRFWDPEQLQDALTGGWSVRIAPEQFTEIIGEDLSGVTFVRDYLQLQFNPPPLINVYTLTTVRCGETTASFGEPAFANVIIGQIYKIVAAVDLAWEEFLEIRFEDGSTITVSLRPEDYVGPEAINLFCKGKSIVVI